MPRVEQGFHCLLVGPGQAAALAGERLDTYQPAMGRDPGLAAAALRLSLGWGTTEQDVRAAAAVIGMLCKESCHDTPSRSDY